MGVGSGYQMGISEGLKMIFIAGGLSLIGLEKHKIVEDLKNRPLMAIIY